MKTLTKAPSTGAPFNATTGTAYNGGTVARLLTAEVSRGFAHDAGWAGFGQWRENGRQVRKGEHGTHGLTVVSVGGDDTGKGAKTTCRGFVVFHYDQTEPIDESATPAPPVTPSAIVARDRAARAAKSEAPSATPEPIKTAMMANAPATRTAAALAALGIK